MSSFIAQTTPPQSQPEVACTREFWRELVQALRERGHHGRRESGAFLLGERVDGQARISQFVPYDDLDPHSLDTGIVRFDGRYYGALWERCRASGLIVVCDVHTHPCGAGQSLSDRANPMISAAGHIAFILPRYAMDDAPMEEIGMYRHLGGRRWCTVPVRDRSYFLRIW